MQTKKTRHPFIGVNWNDWKIILKENKIYYRYLNKLAQISFYSFLTKRNKLREDAAYGEQIKNTKIITDPLFILGHWRSGTTLLENILSCDPRFGYLNTIQSLFPTLFLTTEKKIAANFKAKQREMDNVKLGPYTPSEEEIAMAVLGPGSFWNGYYFPLRMTEYFQKYVLFDGISANEQSLWEDNYLWLIKKLTFNYNNKPLMLKNPPNTCRINMLLKLFPNAKFIHIVRNPYDVYASRRGQYFTSVLHKALQPITLKQWEERTIKYYKAMMMKHLDERNNIPSNNYVEISFEELRKDPVNTIGKIYERLSLPVFEEVKSQVINYCASLSDYKQNQYQLDLNTINTINHSWDFAFDQWHYSKR